MLIPLVICVSHYSFLEGIHSIKDMVDYAAGKGTKALCLADKNGLYGAVEFYVLCREADIHPLIGTELVQGERHVTIVAKNMEGYEELSELVTRYHLGNFHIHDDLSMDSSNLLYICGDHFLLQRWSLWKKGGLPDNLFMLLNMTHRQSCRSLLNLLSHRPDFPPIPAVPVVKLNLLSSSDELHYKVVRAIHHNCTVETLPEEEQSRSPKAPADELQPVSLTYEPVISGVDIAKRCHLELDLERYHLPKFKPVK